MSPSLHGSGKRVLITGAAGGIGSATIAELRKHGARVVGLDLNPGEDGEIIACDVRHQESVDAAIAEGIERLGGLDVLINCAGIGLPQLAGERPNAGSEAVIDINLMGPWRCTGAAIEALLASQGRVVNVSSGLANLTIPLAAAYCASKSGLVAYSDALRLEFGDRITVTTVYPGYIKTPIHDAAAEQGVGLEGAVPPESVGNAARIMARAALGRPIRDLATTRRGTVSYAALRAVPRGVMDRLTLKSFQRTFADRDDVDEMPLTAPISRRLKPKP
jgi:NAD(P)-dependent dehydrogenase (short-subunit alcohol dehydrogenase family)